MSIKQGGNTIAGAVGKYPLNERNISNCITNIPQDIKLELSSGTLTLKAGSKVYVPNGAGVFDEVVIENDIIIPAWGYNGSGLLSIDRGGGIWTATLNEQSSGSVAPTSTQYNLWYDTANNKIKTTSDYSGSWSDGWCLPIAKITSNGSIFTSIDQVFNGFGYIGSTVFALPGVKGLIPDGRNADGSLKNTTTNDFTTVKTVQVNTSTAKIGMYVGGGLGSQTKNFGLNEPENYNYDGSVLSNALEVARVIVDSSAKITSFTPKTIFHAVDYSDTEYIAHQAMPSGRHIDLTFAHGQSYIAPADGYFLLVGYVPNGSLANVGGIHNQSTGLGVITTPSNMSGSASRWCLPVKKGENVIMYLYAGTATLCRFIYANGAQ